MTTENLPVVRTDQAPIPADTDSWTAVVADVSKLSSVIADTEFVPKALRGSAAAVTAAILYGREVGLPPMTALTQVYVLDGRPALYAEAQRALVLAAGHDLEIRAATGATCLITSHRRGTDRWAEVTWTIDMAKAAKLVRDGSGWTKYPRAMLVARATAELCRQLFPDVIHGFVAVEELTDDTVATNLDGQTPQSEGPTTVQRKPSGNGRRKPRKAPSGGPPQGGPDKGPGVAPAAPGPPLPGEAGYDTPTTDSGPGPSNESGAPGGEPGPDQPGSGDGGEGTDRHDAPGAPTPDPAPNPKLRAGIGEQRHKALMAMFRAWGITDHDERVWTLSTIIGRRIDSSKDLTRKEANTVFKTLNMVHSREDLDKVLQATVAYALDSHPETLEAEPIPFDEEP